MAFQFPSGELALLEGFRALLAEYGRTLKVLSDANNSANTPTSTTVGTTFVAVVTSATDADLQTQLGTDRRFTDWCEVDKNADPILEETARLSDGQTTWKVTAYDRSAASATNRYFLTEIQPGVDQ